MAASVSRRTLIVLVVVLSLVLGVASRISSVAAPRPIKVVVLGDSYASGNGAGFYYGPEGCYRSGVGWVEQYVGRLRQAGYGVTLVNRACSGADTGDILKERVMGTSTHTVPLLGDRTSDEAAARQMLAASGQCVARHPDEERYDITATSSFNGLITTFTFTCKRVLAPQIQAVDAGTDLVLLAVGGNDVGFGSLVRNCFVFPDPAGCRNSVNFANGLLRAVRDRIKGVLKAIEERIGPGARVGLVSYPYLEKNDDFTIRSLTDTYRAGEEIRKLGRNGDDIQSEAVSSANREAGRNFAAFIGGIKQRFTGHEPDGEVLLQNPQGWLHELASPIPAEWYHLNLIGHSQYAEHVLQERGFTPAEL